MIFSVRSQWLFSEDLLRHRQQARGVRNGNDADGAEVLVGVQVDDAEFCCVRIFSSVGRRRRHAEARGADALVVGNEQLTVRRVQHNRARRIADRDQAQELVRQLRSTTATALAL